MGLFSRFKASAALGPLQAEVESEYDRLYSEPPHREPFEYLILIWQTQMMKHGKTMMAIHADQYVHLWVITPNAKIACELLARQIAAYVLPDFQKTIQFRELESGMQPIVNAIARGDHENLNGIFTDSCPKAYEAYLKTHSRGPFTPL